MIKHQLMTAEGILILTPSGPLELNDFSILAREVETYIAMHGSLAGLMIHAESFPGWASLDSFVAHIRFIEDHHQKVRRLALVSDSEFLTGMSKLIAQLVHPEVKHFSESEYDNAMRWLKSGA
ncbi:STAS/SEC14 domain-containing protein [Lacipirellula parvula]|uniref:STAS/SEC14 domain-containing protein n=1 Tax=Lacipirellula parvula TaxID=2650471 RepID=A0A5K7X6U8_9BACT|nr:STAS/SEC14 domain-containing protein [Lacipirellula parvula]BBO32268.1 hypothetical protein PLANPX_1880 [Lacipirellula parvula]